jgi:hypothetical protein
MNPELAWMVAIFWIAWKPECESSRDYAFIGEDPPGSELRPFRIIQVHMSLSDAKLHIYF